MLLARSKTQLLLRILITLSKPLNSNYLFFLRLLADQLLA